MSQPKPKPSLYTDEELARLKELHALGERLYAQVTQQQAEAQDEETNADEEATMKEDDTEE